MTSNINTDISIEFLLPRCSLFLVTLFLFGSVAYSQPQEPVTSQVDSLFARWDKPDSPGAVIAIIRDGEVLYKKGYGMANLDHDIPNTPSTIYDIASVSKQFAGMAIAMLHLSEEISLDANINNYVPEVPDFGNPITIRHLVHHTSGLRDWPGTLAIGGWRFDDIISFDQILRMIWKQKELNFEPGARYSYSNTGYNLLAETVTRVSGKSFQDWTMENIFIPIGMTHSHFHDDHQMIVKNRAQAYRKEMDEYKMIPNGLTALASSSLYTSVDDLIKWVLNFETQEVGGDAVISLMHEQGVLNNGEEIAYAFGNSISTYKGLKRVAHSGSWAGFNTYLVRFPDVRFSVIVLSNASELGAGQRAYEIIDLYLNDQFIEEEKTDDEPASITLHEEELDTFIGTYKLGLNWYVTITREDKVLKTKATGEPTFDMIPVAATKFWVPAYGAHIDFKGHESGKATHFEYREYQAPRVEIVTAGEVNIEPYLGVFYSEELEATYTAQRKEGRLVLEHIRHGIIALRPITRDVFSTDSWFMGEVEFVRDAAGEISGLRVSNNRSRNIYFGKLR